MVLLLKVVTDPYEELPLNLHQFFVSDYVEEIFQTLINASKEEMANAAAKLSEKTPSPMNTMLEKQSRDEAIKKKKERSKMVVKDVPPTTPGA